MKTGRFPSAIEIVHLYGRSQINNGYVLIDAELLLGLLHAACDSEGASLETLVEYVREHRKAPPLWRKP